MIRSQYNSGRKLTSMYIYSYFVNGIEYQLKSTAVNPQDSKVGDRCTVWYNPKNPRNALEYRYKSNKLFNILLIVGIALILLSLIMPVAVIAIQANNS